MLRLQGKDIRRIGFEDDQLISVIKNVMQKHYKRSKKTEVLDLLEQLINNPGDFKNDPVLGKIVKAFSTIKTDQKNTQQFQLQPIPLPYKIYGKKAIDPGAIQQMDMAMRLPVTLQGALMPDAHQGYGLPIGGVVATDNAVIPYGVGMDIACRMCLSIYKLSPDYLHQNIGALKENLLNNARFGKNEFKIPYNDPVLARSEFDEIPFLKSLRDKIQGQLGTSGGGNHFVEFGILYLKDKIRDFSIEPGEYLALLSHSGSRNMGASIARHYTQIAKEKCPLPKGATNLAWLSLSGQEGMEYWKAMQLAGDYAAVNHRIIHDRISKTLESNPIVRIENHHNFAWKEKLANGREAIVHRKGATPAHKDAIGIIPGSSVAPAFLVKGKGNPDALNSASHGAGRRLSRAQAKQSFTNKDLQTVLNKKKVHLIGGGLDEVPMAYKNIDMVMDYQKGLVDVLGKFYPIIVRME
jgi:tRNA-splicing ligase RtcB